MIWVGGTQHLCPEDARQGVCTGCAVQGREERIGDESTEGEMEASETQ